MKRTLGILLTLAFLCLGAQAATRNPAAISALLDRIGGQGTAARFEIILDERIGEVAEREVFVIDAAAGKPRIQGSTLSALATGIGWYLNHVAHTNIAWNQLTTDLVTRPLPLPQKAERHEASVGLRYYLNYCTFSYSMSTWTWERWQQEIDWMALHGINMPLQIVGLDVVWRNLLVHDLGYTSAEANRFIAGPSFQAWWGMNNLEGWGGENPDWWYDRQATLARKILQRERELGMEPVLPGYSGMVPSDSNERGLKANSQGLWCGFTRPFILDPNSAAFDSLSTLYYRRLSEVMGRSRYYSMDPFHEGANTAGIDVPSAYSRIYEAMQRHADSAQWVVQQWQWSPAQYEVLRQVPRGRLIVLDLFSDAHSHFARYEGHDAVYCILPNFGGRTGLFGRLGKVMTGFAEQRAQHPNIIGIGAAPEAIGQAPILYDALFELPWHSEAPVPETWVSDYALARYGRRSEEAQEAWQLLARSALACPTALQGPMEAVVCARPSLSVDRVSQWGGTEIFYDTRDVARAAWLLLQSGLEGENLSYDLTDVTRQTLTDHAARLLAQLHQAHTRGNKPAFERLRDTYLQLILDIDRLLSTNRHFLLGQWTQMARDIASEAPGTTEADRRWLEQNNARTLITTWGERRNSEDNGLRDYSYRQWAGMLRDFYYPRWQHFFRALEEGTEGTIDWYASDRAWALDATRHYPTQPQGDTRKVAAELLNKYLPEAKDNH